MNKLAIFGLGEAGFLIARDLVAKGVAVTGFDPAPVQAPAGVARAGTPWEAVAGAEAVIAVTPGGDAPGALEQALDAIPATTLYADFSTNAAAAKQRLAERAASRTIDFADVALMSIVPGKGLYTPAMVSGTGAERFSAIFSGLGMPVEIVSSQAGDAATRKLLRSVMMKGLAAVLIEALRAGEAAGCAKWLWGNLTHELAVADKAFIERLVAGTTPHAVRRLHEMECAEELLRQLGIDSVMTRSTVESLRYIPELGIPAIPQIT